MKRTITGKSFKLIDFRAFDQKPTKDDDESSTDDDEKKVMNIDESKFTIQMFGVNESGETCSIITEHYNPFFYVKCGDNWNQSHADIFLVEIQQKVGNYYKKSIIKTEMVQYNKLYGFTAGKQSKFIKVTFRSVAVMNKVKNFWFDNSGIGERKMIRYTSQRCNMELYESNLPPLLRCFHIYNISPSGWILVRTDTATKVPEHKKTTTCKYEYICNINQIIPQPNKETIVPYKICSFDIEASSSHGDFPLPIKTYKRLAANFYLKRFIPVDIVVSNTSFISIEYVHPKLSNPLSIKLPKNYFLVGNEILSDIFVCRYLSYEYGRHVIFADMEYKLNIIDSNVNILSIGKDKYIVLTEDGYLVKDIEDLKIY
jgi:DNA polymerase family B, exonuclease domain